MKKLAIRLALCAAFLAYGSPALAESQGSEYKGITDPFGDPANYEFADDEREDKEFFHLGRYIMVGLDIGVGIFTGGLGSTIEPGPYFGGHVVYFFDRQLAFEVSGHFGTHLDQIRPDATSGADIDTQLVTFHGGFRYYFDTRNAPKAIAIANPYLAFGGGLYMRSQTVVDSKGFTPAVEDATAFGGYAGGGVEFSIYRRHIYLGLDLRYHLIFFPDEDSTLGKPALAGTRGGDYFTTAATITYNF